MAPVAVPLLQLGLVLSFVSFVLCGANLTTLGKPISIPASQYWDGDDGQWSTFRVQVGTPAQQVRLLPALDQSSTWLIVPEALQIGACPSDAQTCEDSRGFFYRRNVSSTWKEHGSFDLSTFVESPVGLTGVGLYGFETMQLGWQGDGLPSLTHQVVAGIYTKNFYIGSLSLNPRPMNFTDFNDPQPSLMQSLRNMSTPIPSTSWSYTAGSYNLSPKVFGSLTIGGYDSTRFVENNVTFPFGADISLDFQVAIQSITTDLTDAPLLKSGIIAYIDTLVAQIWLPLEACKLFEDAFGLVWDNKTELYLLNDSTHDALLAKNPNVTFRVGPEVTGDSASIVLPYWNFYHTAKPPFINSTSLYFPLKRAHNESQYLLGRAFMQSAYITANYDRNTFNLSQALYPASSVDSVIVPIFPEVEATNATAGPQGTDNEKSSTLSTGVKAGIAVGAVAVICIVSAAIFYLYRRKRRQAADIHKKRAELEGQDSQITDNDKDPKIEIDSEERHEIGGESHGKTELSASGEHIKIAEVEGDGVVMVLHEMPAGDVHLPELEGSNVAEMGNSLDLRRTSPNISTVITPPTPQFSPKRHPKG